jgi:hypothetical protein
MDRQQCQERREMYHDDWWLSDFGRDWDKERQFQISPQKYIFSPSHLFSVQVKPSCIYALTKNSVLSLSFFCFLSSSSFLSFFFFF